MMKKKNIIKCTVSHDYLVGEFDGVLMIKSCWVRATTFKEALSGYDKVMNPDSTHQLLILKVEESR